MTQQEKTQITLLLNQLVEKPINFRACKYTKTEERPDIVECYLANRVAQAERVPNKIFDFLVEQNYLVLEGRRPGTRLILYQVNKLAIQSALHSGQLTKVEKNQSISIGKLTIQEIRKARAKEAGPLCEADQIKELVEKAVKHLSFEEVKTAILDTILKKDENLARQREALNCAFAELAK